MNSDTQPKIIPDGSYLSKRGYVVKKDSISKEELQYVKKHLRATPLQDEKYNNYNNDDSSYPIYTETKNKLYLPKMYGIKRYGDPKRYIPNYIGKDWESDNDLQFVGNLFPNQIEPVNSLLNACKTLGGGILKAGTGTGKTLMSVHIISKLRVKTIVVVNKIPLMRQWESELKRFIPGITVGFIQGQKNVSVEGADVVIAMLQSLARVEYPDSLFEDFSLAIIDEIHNTSSRVFSQVLGKLCCRYTIGLSATPKRSDGCEYVFKYHIGDIVHESDVKRSGLPPVLKYIKIDSSEYNEISVVNRFTGQKQIQFTSMLSELITMPKRNRIILELIKDLVTNDNRKVLVLSDRREHLKNLKTDLDKDLSVDFTYGLFLGQMKQKDLQLSRASQVIFATFSAFGEGVSEKDLDTLILITPKKFVGHLKNSVKNESGKLEQIVGRIFRKDHTDKNPLIVDLHDNFSVYKNQSAQRRTFYKQHFTNAKTIYNQINLDEYETNDIKISCIKQTKTTGQIQENEDVNKTEQLLKHCVIED
jgi:superfamily II DNA or RNA helicase